MKKLFFVILVALALTACSLDMPELDIPTPDDSQDITTGQTTFDAAVGKIYTWQKEHFIPIFSDSYSPEDEKKFTITEKDDGSLELVSKVTDKSYGTLTDIAGGKATVAGKEITISEDASILTVGGATYNV